MVAGEDGAMPSGLKRFQQAESLHFITFSCFHRLPLLETPGARETVEAVLEQTLARHDARVYAYVLMAGGAGPQGAPCPDFRTWETTNPDSPFPAASRLLRGGLRGSGAGCSIPIAVLSRKDGKPCRSFPASCYPEVGLALSDGPVCSVNYPPGLYPPSPPTPP